MGSFDEFGQAMGDPLKNHSKGRRLHEAPGGWQLGGIVGALYAAVLAF